MQLGVERVKERIVFHDCVDGRIQVTVFYYPLLIALMPQRHG